MQAKSVLQQIDYRTINNMNLGIKYINDVLAGRIQYIQKN